MPTHNHVPAAGHSVLDAARIAGVGRSTIYEELAAGRLAAKKIGRRTLITEPALREWLDRLPDYKAVATASVGGRP